MKEKPPKEKAISALQDMCSVAGLLYNGIRSDHTFTTEKAGVYISNLEFYIKDLSAYYGYDSVLAKQVTERYAELKQANIQIARLQKTIQELDINSDAVSAKLKSYEDIARAFYEAAGFHYGSVTFKERFLTLDMSAEYDYDMEPHLTTLKGMMYEIREAMEQRHLLGFATFPESSYREYIEDTPRNKKGIMDLYKAMLPGSYITEFRQREEHGHWMLRHEVNIPYGNLEALHKAYSTKQDDTPKPKTAP